MSFELRVIEFSAETIQKMKPAVFHKIAESLPRAIFKYEKTVTVTKSNSKNRALFIRLSSDHSSSLVEKHTRTAETFWTAAACAVKRFV